MRILHTSDWHLGRRLYGQGRYAEFEAFLNWLPQRITEQRIDVLLVAGDVFDTGTPSNRAQSLYYRFLRQIADTPCRHVVIIAGNHDSPSFLDAPKGLLRALDIHVIGSSATPVEEQVLLLDDPQGQSALIVCAVPYLRDRDIRLSEAGESIEEKSRKLIQGMADHYRQVIERARQLQQKCESRPPIVAMGHLFTAGGQTREGDGVRELYVGNLAHLPAACFPEAIDYLALGHLHLPQTVGGNPLWRYSGSPLPMGFGEAKQQKSLCLVEFSAGGPQLELLPVPMFQAMETIRGSGEEIEARIRQFMAQESDAWLEIDYQGESPAGALRESLEQLIAGSRLKILRIRNTRLMERVLHQDHPEEELQQLNPDQVFERCLAAYQIPPDEAAELRLLYQEAVRQLQESDPMAE